MVIYTPDISDPYNLIADLELMAESIQQEIDDSKIKPWRSLWRIGGASQSVPTGVYTTMGGWFSTPDDPGNGGSSITYGSGQFTVSEAGVYRVYCRLVTASGAPASTYQIRARKNGIGLNGTNTPDYNPDSTGFFHIPDMDVLMFLEPGDTAGFEVHQNTGVSVNIGEPSGSAFQIYYVSSE